MCCNVWRIFTLLMGTYSLIFDALRVLGMSFVWAWELYWHNSACTQPLKLMPVLEVRPLTFHASCNAIQD